MQKFLAVVDIGAFIAMLLTAYSMWGWKGAVFAMALQLQSDIKEIRHALKE